MAACPNGRPCVQKTMPNSLHAIVLFSGGLDSILAVKLLQGQGLRVRGIHFYSPFFGNPAMAPEWEKNYGLEITTLDIGAPFSKMLALYPEHGVGSAINPCIDCKIMQISAAHDVMRESGAAFLASGEVLGQRPMSQRADCIRMIPEAAGVSGLLLRPLCALRLPPTPMEESGLVDRSRLLGISGRGRNDQLQLARQLNIGKIPTPAGGCLLTERENTRRYWPILKKYWQDARLIPEDGSSLARDFTLAAMGRQFWRKDGQHWLRIGRNSADNEKLLASASSRDLVLKLANRPGPIGIAANGTDWEEETLREACGLVAGYVPAVVQKGAPIPVRTFNRGGERSFRVRPVTSSEHWGLPTWEETRVGIRETAKEKAASRKRHAREDQPLKSGK